jgi:hypothetical protein
MLPVLLRGSVAIYLFIEGFVSGNSTAVQQRTITVGAIPDFRRLMLDQVESLKAQTFGGLSKQEFCLAKRSGSNASAKSLPIY